ncbi:hypothetical protein [Deinococcus sp. 6GRE01]|uniref:hypothetical protein n=1 Tax=Deinococcus sp. 6GRE01 TaxID=2745873 RepID=UPI001E4AEE83|nr:hypothetical protein [Deinococcus sp. 6GRE01]MCD0156009.1 hypothetical protein [Deinococcus sp. 6GRE01]
MSSSPMTSPRQHDKLVLLEGSKRWVIPGVSRVSVGLEANVDSAATPGEGDAVTQLNEATAEVNVTVTMWTSDQWDQYRHVLSRLRRGTKDGPAVFTSAHPEIRNRRMKRLYFVSESADPYNPREGYKVKLTFREKLKDKAKAKAVTDEGEIIVPGSGTTPATGDLTAGPTASAAGLRVQQEALAAVLGTPAPAGGTATTATPGYCSASVRVPATKAGLPPSLFGASALATEGNFKRAGLTTPWTAGSLQTVQNGDVIFWANDPSGYGHTGIVVGRDKDGMPLIAGNNLVTYKARGGRFDSRGMPIDKHIDSRGIVRLDALSSANSQPTTIGRAGGFPAAPKAPATGVPLPQPRPSQNVQIPIGGL